MKKIYSAPVAKSTVAVRETLSGSTPTPATENLFSTITPVGFGL